MITPNILKRAAHHSSVIVITLFAILSLAFFTTTICAQTPSLHGEVTDQNGAIVVGAKITLHGQTGQTRTSITDRTGAYSFANLPAGDYTVAASRPKAG